MLRNPPASFGRSNHFMTALLLASTFGFLGCGLSKKSKGTNAAGDAITHIEIQLDGSLLGYDYWEGGFEVYAVGENDDGDPLAFSDGSTRSKVSLSKGSVNESTSVTPKGLLTFDLPAAATKWKLTVDSIVGRDCEFSPSEGAVADIPSGSTSSTSNSSGLLLPSSDFTINSTCTSSYQVAGTVDMAAQGLKITFNDQEFTVDTTGDSNAFSVTWPHDVTFVNPPAGGSQVILGNARAFWADLGLTASNAKVADGKISAKLADDQPCSINPASIRMEETVTLSAGDTSVSKVPPYFKIFNRLGAIQIKCKKEPTLALGGKVTNLNGSLVLETAAGDSVTVTTSSKSDADFTFPDKIFSGDDYEVTIKTQPQDQTCTISSGSTGTPTKDVTDLAISCVDIVYAIGGSVSGQTGAFVVSAGSKTADISASATSYSVTDLPPHSAYTLTVSTQPSGQFCSVAAAGTVSALESDVTTANITCVARFSLGGNVTGLTGTLKLRNNITLEVLTITADGAYTFSNIFNGDDYDVRIYGQPSGQTCTFDDSMKAVGTLTGDVSDVNVTCI